MRGIQSSQKNGQQSEQKTLDVSEIIISDKSLTKLKRILNPGRKIAHREDKDLVLYLDKDEPDPLSILSASGVRLNKLIAIGCDHSCSFLQKLEHDCRNLEHLDLSDTSSTELSIHLPRLRVLVINGVNLRKIEIYNDTLERLEAKQCPQLDEVIIRSRILKYVDLSESKSLKKLIFPLKAPHYYPKEISWPIYVDTDKYKDLRLDLFYKHPMHYQHIRKIYLHSFDYSDDSPTLMEIIKATNSFVATLFQADEKLLPNMRRSNEANASICKSVLKDNFFKNLILLARHSPDIFLQNSLIRTVIPLISLTDEDFKNFIPYGLSRLEMTQARYRAAQIIFDLNKLMPELRQYVGHTIFGWSIDKYTKKTDDAKRLPKLIALQEEQEKLEIPDELKNGVATIVNHLIYLTCSSFDYEDFVKHYAFSERPTNVGILIHSIGNEEKQQFYYGYPRSGGYQLEYHAKSIAKIKQQLAKDPRTSWEFYVNDITDSPAKKRLISYMRFIETRWLDQPDARFASIMVVLALKEVGIIDTIMIPPTNYDEGYLRQANTLYYEYTSNYAQKSSLINAGLLDLENLSYTEWELLYSKTFMASCFDEYQFLNAKAPLSKTKKDINSIDWVFSRSGGAWHGFTPHYYFFPIYEFIRHPDKFKIMKNTLSLDLFFTHSTPDNDQYSDFIWSLLVKEKHNQEMDNDGLFEINDFFIGNELESLINLLRILHEKEHKDLWFFISEKQDTIKFKNPDSLHLYLKCINIILNISPNAIQPKRLLIFINDLLNQISFKFFSGKKIKISSDKIHPEFTNNIATILGIIICYLDNIQKPIISMARNHITLNLRLCHLFFIKEKIEYRSIFEKSYIKAVKLFTHLSCRLKHDIAFDFSLLVELFRELQLHYSKLYYYIDIIKANEKILDTMTNCLILFIKTVYSGENGEKRCESLKQIFIANQDTLNDVDKATQYYFETLNERIRLLLENPYSLLKKSLPAPLLLEIPDLKLSLPQMVAAPTTLSIALPSVGAFEESSVHAATSASSSLRVSIPSVSSTIFYHPVTELSLAPPKKSSSEEQGPSAQGVLGVDHILSQ